MNKFKQKSPLKRTCSQKVFFSPFLHCLFIVLFNHQPWGEFELISPSLPSLVLFLFFFSPNLNLGALFCRSTFRYKSLNSSNLTLDLGAILFWLRSMSLKNILLGIWYSYALTLYSPMRAASTVIARALVSC